MYITLRCSGCDATTLVSFESLYALWKQGYDTMTESRKKKAKVKANVQCHCGSQDDYDTPMFRYIFQLIFEAFRGQSSIE